MLCLVVAICAAGAAAWAQQPQYAAKLQIDNEEVLAQKANELIDVNLDENLLRIIPRKITTKTEEGKVVDIGAIIAGLKGVYVRSYGFNAEGEYTEANIARVRTQLRSPGWLRIVNVMKKKEGQTVEVYMMTGGERVGGLAIVATEPKRLTLVNIVGMIDLEKLSQLEGQFGIPELGIEREDKDEREGKSEKATATKKP